MIEHHTSFCYHWHVITQTISVVLFTSGLLFFTWERPLDTLSGISPRYLSATYYQLTTSPFYRYYMMTNYAFFLQGSDRWGKDLTLLWGHLNICPSLQQFHILSITQLELSSFTSLKAWGTKKIFTLPSSWYLPRRRDRKYGLSTIWVNPCQARVCSMEEAVKELTAWVSSGPDWPYTLVQLDKDTCHAPLPKEWHLGILPEGGTDSTTCRRISQMEVHQLLISGL